MGGWDRDADGDRAVLEHIVGLLFALAHLADLAACAPFLRRWKVLGILDGGEAAARALLIGLATGVTVDPADVPEEADDAASLAIRFRALALALCVLLMRGGRSALPGAASLCAGRPSQKICRPAAHWSNAIASPAPDTS